MDGLQPPNSSSVRSIKMKTNLDKYKNDLERLIKTAEAMKDDFACQVTGKKPKTKSEIDPGQLFFGIYQKWYTEAHEVIRQILPNRLEEFERLYKGDQKRKKIDGQTYTIQDWLRGIRSGTNQWTGEKFYNDESSAFMQFQMQVELFKSAKARFESSLFDLRKLLQADLFDSEIEAGRELLKNGFLRGAGAIAGVVLEKHLGEVCGNHSITIKKKDLTISYLNDLLKDANVVDIPNWRFIQRLGDLRNLCDHNKKREPTAEEVEELINGTDKIMKSVF